MNDRKSVSGLPLPGPAPRPVVMSAEARIARRRLRPSTIVYGASSAAILLSAVHRGGVGAPGVHFCGFRGRYFQYIRRHHLYHHGSRIGSFAFGLTSGVWDRVYGTDVPPLAARRRFATSSVAAEAPSSEPPSASRRRAASSPSRWRAGTSA